MAEPVALLRVLAERPRVPASKDALMNAAWGDRVRAGSMSVFGSEFMGRRHATLHPALGNPFFDGLRMAGLPE